MPETTMIAMHPVVLEPWLGKVLRDFFNWTMMMIPFKYALLSARLNGIALNYFGLIHWFLDFLLFGVLCCVVNG